MNRKEALLGMAVIGATALVPKVDAKKSLANRIHFVGLGSASLQVLSYIKARENMGKYTIITNPNHLSKIPGINVIPFKSPGETYFKDKKEVHHKSDMSQRLSLSESVTNLFSEDEFYVLFACLGGYTGTYMAEELTEFLINSSKRFVTICSLPFKFEANRRKYAIQTVSKLNIYQNFIYFDNENINEIFGNPPILKIFEQSTIQFHKAYKNFLDSLN
jgi:hypothetical protein